MSNLTTRKIVLGLLMALVLAFGVQGIADALTFGTTRTGDLQTASEQQEFRITFSVSLASNTTPIRDANGRLIKDNTSDGGGENARIDRSGYLVVDIGTSEYREITINPVGTPLVTDSTIQYFDQDPSPRAQSPYYVDTNNRVVDSTGAAVYVQAGTGTPANNDDPQNPVAADPWRYTRATAQPTTKVPDANRYHYQQERVTITSFWE